jgi:secreted trypsin-like serine protease
MTRDSITRAYPSGGLTRVTDRRYASSEFVSLTQSSLGLSQNVALDNGGACYGDSGGAEFLGGVDSDLQVALVSWGDYECKSIGFAYRLDTPSARNYLARFVTLP